MFLRISACLCLATIHAVAQSLSAQDDAAIRKVIASFVEAQNKHDAAAATRLFTQTSPDREQASKAIANEPRVWTEKTPVSPAIKAIRTLHADVALADVTLSWYTSARGAMSSDRVFLFVKESGEWKITAYRHMCKDPSP